ncbi:hypothetical protein [Dyadobacter luteus]|jgi:hypothetical protein|nr:hypothetical protein [Dyadobacter luteus]
MLFDFHLFVFCVLIIQPLCEIEAQPRFTRMRAGFAIDAGGTAPAGAVSAEMPLYYGEHGFLNMQAGIGLADFTTLENSFSTSFSTTYNRILNGYRRDLCRPAPDHNKFELYLETGLALSTFHPRTFYAGKNRLRYHFHQMGIIGLRTHYVSPKWIYTFKIRATPLLTPDIQFWAGASAGIGWR